MSLVMPKFCVLVLCVLEQCELSYSAGEHGTDGGHCAVPDRC